MNRAQINSHKTAIGRTKPSAPARWLVENRYIDHRFDRVLDYGCGRGFDADYYGWNKYDPHYFPIIIAKRKKEITWAYPIVLCSYVLNTLPKKHENALLENIQYYLEDSMSAAYITVRRNIKKVGYTSKGTYQRNVKLKLPVVHETSDYCIYLLKKDSKI